MALHQSTLIATLIDRVSAPARAAGASLQRLSLQAQHASRANARAMDNLRGKMIDAMAVAYATARAISSPIKAAIDFESQMADVRKVVDFASPEAFAAMGREIVDMSRRIPIAASGLAEIVAAAGQAGIATGELTKFAEGAAKVGVAFDISAGLAGEAMAKLRTAFGFSNEQVFSLADAMNHLSNAQASSAEDILDVVRRVGAQATMFGFTAEQTAAFGSAMLSAGAESEVAATSFRNMGLALTKGASATKAQRGAYKALGLDAKRVAKDMQRDAVGTTLDVIKRLAALPAETRASVASALFGNEARALGPLLTRIELLEESLGLVADKTDYAGSAQKEFEVRSKTTANAIQLFRNSVTALGIAVGNALTPALNSAMAKLSPMIAGLARWSEQNPQLVSGLTQVVAGLVGLRVATIGTAYAFRFLKGGALSALSGVANAAALAASAFGALLKPLRLVTGALAALRFAVISTGIGAALVGIAMAGTWIANNWDGLSAMFQSFAATVAPALGPMAGIISRIYDAVSGLVGPLNATNAQWKSWGETLGGGVVSAINAVAGAIRSVIGALGAAYDKAVAVGQALRSWWNTPAPAGTPGRQKNWATPSPAPSAETPAVPGRASGGYMSVGQIYQYQERGREYAFTDRDAYAVPEKDLAARGVSARRGGPARGPISINLGGVTISGVQNVDRAAERLAARLSHELSGVFADYERELI